MTRAPGKRRQLGFTLVELLIGISLVSLMLVVMFGGLRLGGRSWDAIERQSSASSEMRPVREFIRRSLRQIQGPQVRLSDGRRLLFSGNAEAIELVTPLGGYLGLGGAYVVRLQATRGSGDGGQLVLTRWLNHPEVLEGDGGIPAWQPLTESSALVHGPLETGESEFREYFGQQVLLDSVEELELGYFGTKTGDEEPDWYDEWDDPRRLPDLVRVRLQLSSGWWPDLLVQLPDAFAPGSSGRRSLPGAF
jgi:general secretion pathway protein J